MNKLLPISLLCASCLQLSSCTSASRSAPPAPQPTTEVVQPETETLARQFQALPNFQVEKLDNTFPSWLESYAQSHSPQEIKKILNSQLKAKCPQLPLLPEFTYPLRFVSVFDSTVTSYRLRIPKDPHQSKSVVLFLGTEEDYLKYGLVDSQTWTLWIPSREGMNYQLIAEADLFGALEQAKELFPQLASLPLYIVGAGNGACPALYLANAYRYRFSGVAFTGGDGLLQLPNLDQFPVTSFSPEPHSSTVWSNEQIIDFFKERGNSQAEALNGDLVEALDFLRSSSPSSLLPYQFRNHRHSRVYPWLRILAKKNESEPVHVSVSMEKNTLHIQAPNASGIEITRDSSSQFPQQISKLRFNGEWVSLSRGNQHLRVGEVPYGAHWKQKSSTPGTLYDFFCHDPVCVIYQDDEASDEYLAQAKFIAEQLAKLNLRGLSQTNVQLPLLPLSSYTPKKQLPHRALFVGMTHKVPQLLESSSSTSSVPYTPIQLMQRDLYLNQHPLNISLKDADGLAFGLTYPPEDNSSLLLAFALAADDLEGLKALADHYLSVTALYQSSNLNIWIRQKGSYTQTLTYTFDSYWGTSQIPSQEVAIPVLPRKVWISYLEDLLIQSTNQTMMALSPLINPLAPVPTTLGYRSLSPFIPSQNFCIVRCKGRVGLDIVNHLLENTRNPHVTGMQQWLKKESETPQLDPQLVGNKSIEVLMDRDALYFLTPAQRKQISYTPYPYSLQELVSQRARQNPTAMGKELLRVGRAIAEKPSLESFR